MYFNEHEVGQAIREKIADGTVRREDIFYCGKVKRSGIHIYQGKKAVQTCLTLCENVITS